MSQPDASDAPAASPSSVVIIGAGPAGLTAAYQLAKRGVTATILEADDIVGGISRTVERDGWRFDIGGHRFFTKVREVDDLWFEILGPEEFLQRPRMSRILYRGKLYDYPLKPVNALRNLGPVEAVRCVGSYAYAKVRPPEDTSNLEGFYVSQFGWRLYEHFFRRYNEKVWGVPTKEMSADFGAQRSKGMSLMTAIVESLTPKAIKSRRGKGDQVTSLIESFNYPKYGPGQMWEKAAELVTDAGSEIVFHTKVVRIRHRDGAAYEVDAVIDGQERTFPATQRHLVDAVPFADPGHRPAGPRRGARRRRGAHLPRLHDRRARRAGGVLVPGQLDLHPRPRGEGRSHPELRVLVAVPGQGRAYLPRSRVLRERG